MVKKLHTKAGKAKISPEVAVGALGYNGLNGAALGTLGTLTQYGLIDRERGKSVSVSPLAIKLIHPLNPAQETAAKQESALLPQVFKELVSEGFHKCEEELIANHLIQNGFTPDGARKAASVFKENISIAKLEDCGINTSGESETEDKAIDTAGDKDAKLIVPLVSIDHSKGKNVLATYSIPLGSNEVTITFTGEELSVYDFDALADYVAIFRKQFERKQNAEASKPVTPKPAFPEPPFSAKRRTATGETMVEIIGQPWFENGKWIFQAKGGILVPADEILPNVQK